MKVIEVIVSPRGEATVLTRGFAGPECELASRALEEALGTRRCSRRTVEFYRESEPQRTEARQ